MSKALSHSGSKLSLQELVPLGDKSLLPLVSSDHKSGTDAKALILPQMLSGFSQKRKNCCPDAQDLEAK